jgi:hypothetical protein
MDLNKREAMSTSRAAGNIYRDRREAVRGTFLMSSGVRPEASAPGPVLGRGSASVVIYSLRRWPRGR